MTKLTDKLSEFSNRPFALQWCAWIVCAIGAIVLPITAPKWILAVIMTVWACNIFNAMDKYDAPEAREKRQAQAEQAALYAAAAAKRKADKKAGR